MAGNTTSITNIPEICKLTNVINDNRKNIIVNCARIKESYNKITQLEWDGFLRMEFHKAMFGEDNETGLIGEILRITSSMNETLWNFACYVTNVYNLQNPYSTYRAEDFGGTKNIDNVLNIKVEKSYGNFDADNVKTPGDNFVNFKSGLYDYLNDGITNSTAVIKDYLGRLTNYIQDESVETVKAYASNLEEKVLEIKQIFNKLLSDLEAYGQKVDAELKKAAASQEQISSNLNN